MLWTVYDALARPGEPVEILARCETRIGGLVRVFRRGRTELHVGARRIPLNAGARGFATARLEPAAKEGVIPLRADASPAGQAGLWITRPERPILITDLDRTLSDATAWGFWLRPIDRVQPFPGARETLLAAAREHLIVYLTARTDLLLAKTRRWFRHHDFPTGPVLCRFDFRRDADEETFKTRVVREIRKRWPRIRLAVGDKASDIRAYRAAGVPAIRFGEGKGGQAPSYARWDAIRELLSDPSRRA